MYQQQFNGVLPYNIYANFPGAFSIKFLQYIAIIHEYMYEPREFLILFDSS